MRRARLAMAGIVLAAAPAAAQDLTPDRFTLMLGSHHVNAKDDFNDFNPGVLFTWETPTVFDVTVGGFYNSYSRFSLAGFVSVPIIEHEHFVLELFGGLAWYPIDGRRFAISLGDTDIIPMGGLQARVGHFAVQVIPSDGVWTDAIVSGGVTFGF